MCEAGPGAAPGVDKWPSVVYSDQVAAPEPALYCTVHTATVAICCCSILITYYVHLAVFYRPGSSVPTYLVNVMSSIINAVYTAVSVAEWQCPCCRQLGNKSLSTLQQPVPVPDSC